MANVISATGHYNPASVWGTAAGSLLIGSMRYYITKKRQGFTINEAQVMSNCRTVVPVLYRMGGDTYKDLPGVDTEATMYLLQLMSKWSSNEVPMSLAEDWDEMQETALGKDVMTTLNDITTIAKKVPEAFVHPLSQIIELLCPPVVRHIDGEVKFVIYSGDANPVPNMWEMLCMTMKDDLLPVYITYRLSGMQEPDTLSRIVSEMNAGGREE